uniref:DNA-directed DNA polymerase n=1 Tax=Lepisosteus oculatus TaxID=7918 RepID=W5M2M0_LEPOC
VCDASRLSQEERALVLRETAQASVIVLTMVYQDGTAQLNAEQKSCPPVSGVLVLLKSELDAMESEGCSAGLPGSEGSGCKVIFLKLEQRPAWAQQGYRQDRFSKEMLLCILGSAQDVICFKAKDLLCTALQYFGKEISWKQVALCRILDPQIAAWLLDPADTASCFWDLVAKRCKTRAAVKPCAGAREFEQQPNVSGSLLVLYRLMMDLRASLQEQGLWKLFCSVELRLTTVLAVMEIHRIHVDKDALEKTSKILGMKLKQLEQEAHQAAGQQFLVSSSSQLRVVLFEKLRLHERCENKKLPKTVLRQQQSTSEATLMQLQDLHPLPKIILEYRQVHKIKSAYVDGILSCMISPFYNPKWGNTSSAVTGPITSKKPNIQAIPRQSIQIIKKQYVQGKEPEVITIHPRSMFISEEGWTFLAADFSQVELRLLAHLSSDPELLRVFQEPLAAGDVFISLASQWKGLPEGKLKPEDREQAKRIVYSVVYGAGKERLSEILGLTAEQAGQFVDSFLQKYKQVRAFTQKTIQQCQDQGCVVSIMGRRRHLPHILSPDWTLRNQAERQAVNFVVQGSAADLCKMAMIRIFSHIASSPTLTARLIAQIHDELLFEVEDSQVEEFAGVVQTTMESLQHIDCFGVHLKVPLRVMLSSGKSWGSLAELARPRSLPHRL